MGRGLAGLEVFVVPDTFPLSKLPTWTCSLGRSKVAGKVSAGAAWLSSSTWGAMSTWELEGLATHKAGG